MATKLTELQEKKVLRVFSIFFDINNDGVIEWKDFEIAIEKVRTLHQWDATGSKYMRALDAIKQIWDGLRQHADKDQDGTISEDEWKAMWAETIQDLKKTSELPPWLKLYQEFMFDVNDTSGDNFIDKEEYTTVYTGYGLPVDQCHKAFDQFQCTGGLTKDHFARLWLEYFTSDNHADPGTHLFGYLD